METPRTPVIDLAALGRGAYSTYLWGESRPVLHRLQFAMARAVDPAPLWLDLASAPAPGEEPGPVELGWIPSDRLFRPADPDADRPQNGVANMAIGHVVRSDDPPESVARLADFLRLPSIKQEIISRLTPGDVPRALAVVNSERVRSSYPSTAQGVRPFLAALLEAPLRPYFSVQGPAGEARFAFDYVFRVRADDLAHWSGGSLVPEKAPSDSGIREGEPIALRDIPGLSNIFEARPGPK